MDERPAEEAEPTEEDFAVADRLMAERLVPTPSEPDARALQRRMLAEARTGDPRDFDLRYGLREPDSRSERVRRDLFREGLGFEEYARRLKVHATRPVDEAMLRDCYEAKEGRAESYSEMLLLALDGRDDEPGSKEEYRSERAIDAAVSKLERKVPVFGSELESVWRRAIDVRSEDQSPPSLGCLVGDSMFEIATRVLSMAVSTWRESKSLAHKTRGVSRYEHATAASLFCKRWFDGNPYPTPSELASGLRHEAARALRDVKRRVAEDARLAQDDAERRAPGARESGRNSKRDAIDHAAAQVHSDVGGRTSATSAEPTSAKKSRAVRKGMPWEEARRRAESLIETFSKWPGKRKLAQLAGCAPVTMKKAINNSKVLTRFRRVLKGAPKEVATDPSAIDRIASTDSRDEQLNALIAEQAADQRRDARKGARSRSKE